MAASHSGRFSRWSGSFEAGQTLRLLTTFEPIPLYAVLGQKGFSHVASRHGEGDWEILFIPDEREAITGGRSRASSATH